jgi:hypothetical protein
MALPRVVARGYLKCGSTEPFCTCRTRFLFRHHPLAACGVPLLGRVGGEFVLQQRPRFSDCALHDMTRDKAGVGCYPMRPAIRTEALATERHANAAQVYGRKCPASDNRTAGTEDAWCGARPRIFFARPRRGNEAEASVRRTRTLQWPLSFRGTRVRGPPS